MEIRSSVFQQNIQQEMFFLAGAIGRFRPLAAGSCLLGESVKSYLVYFARHGDNGSNPVMDATLGHNCFTLRWGIRPAFLC